MSRIRRADLKRRSTCISKLFLKMLMLCLCLSYVGMMGGCSKDEMKKMATSVQQTTQDFAVQSQEYIQGAVETVEKQLPSSGSIALKLEPPVEMDAGNLEILTVGDGRANVVQVASYDTTSGPNKYPCILLHGQTQSKSADDLVGQTVPCDLYFQQSNGGAILMTSAGASVQVTFGQMDKKSGILMASIGSGTLISSEHKKVSFNGGNVMAIIQGGQQ